jgi:EmrB/QacA subfamily drug resistance transporter
MQYKWQAALIVALGLFMAILDNTIVNVALPAMQATFHTDRNTIIWVVTAYFLAQAAIIPAVGYLSDRIGTKTVFLVALALFTIGSGLCAFTPTGGLALGGATIDGKTLLIAFRVLQGLGGGALFPIAFAITFRVFPPTERGPASAVIGVPVLLAPVFGPTIGGYLTKYYDWPAIFKVNLPIGILTFALALLFLRGHAKEVAAGDEEPAAAQKGFDVLGLVLAMTGTVALSYGINQSGTYGLNDLSVWPYLAAGGVLLLAFALYELRHHDPVMDLRLFTNYTFTMSNVLTWMLSVFLFGFLFFLPAFFENVQGRDALNTGLILAIQGIAAIVGVVAAGRLYNVTGPRPLVVLGLALTTIGSYGFINLTASTDPQTLQAWLAVRGLGFGLANIPLQTLVMARISNRAMARASSLVNVTRQIFGALGLSILTAYFTTRSTAHATDLGSAYYAANSTTLQQNCVAQVGFNPSAIHECITHAVGTYVQSTPAMQIFVTNALNDTFYVSMLGTLVATVLALFIGRDPNVEKLKEEARRAKKGEPPLPAPDGTEARRPALVGE